MIKKIKDRINYAMSMLFKTGFFHVFGSSTISKIVAFASGILLVRVLSKDDYGVFSYANTIFSFFMLASGFGCISGVLQLCSEERDDNKRRDIYKYGCKVSFFVNIVISLIILCVAIFVPLKIVGSNYCLGLMAFLPIVSIMFEIKSVYLRSELKNKEFAKANLFSTICSLLLLTVLSYFFGINGLVFAKYMVVLLPCLFITIFYKLKYNISRRNELTITFTSTHKKEFWKISIISMLNNGLSELMYLLDVFVLGIFISDSTVIASYKVASNIPTALAFIPAAIITYLYPYFARNREDRMWVIRNYRKVTIAMLILTAFIAVVMFILAPWFIPLIFGNEYTDSVTIFRVLCVSFAISSTFRVVPGNILVTQRKLTFNLIIATLSSLLNTVLNVFMIRNLASVGAAYATLLTVILSSIADTTYLIYILRKRK